jgi:hypothetical protein
MTIISRDDERNELWCMHIIHLNIFSNNFKVLCNDSEVIEHLKLDFSYFISSESNQNAHSIYVLIQNPPWDIIPEISATKQTDTSIIYEKDNVRYNDYHGEALTTVRKGGESFVYCNETSLAHELSYLLILSKSGKSMDLRGLHKIHAMGLQYQRTNLLFISSSKGGKSTHFLGLLNDPKFKIYSDDTPVIDRKGNIYPFPLRIGIEEDAPVPSYVNKEHTYKMIRKKFGPKILIPIQSIQRELATDTKPQRTILVIGKRSRKKRSQIKQISALAVFPHLLKYMIVGIGLPMILEYFLETGFKDIVSRFKIIVSRTIAASALIIRSEKYLMETSSNVPENCSMMIDLISNGQSR